jgi:Zn-dependent peptidase ImmA (M78 family)
MPLNYEKYYVKLKNSFPKQNLIVDFSTFGWASKITKKNIFVVHINPTLSYKYRFFILAHEISHFFKLTSNKLIETKLQTEENANKRTLKLLTYLLKKDVSKDYMKFYRYALKTNELANK